MRTPPRKFLVSITGLAAGLLVFSHGFAADNVIRLAQPLKLELPASDSTKSSDAESNKGSTPATSKEVVKNNTPAMNDPSVSDEEKAQQKLADLIKTRLAALRAKNEAREAYAKSHPSAKRGARAGGKKRGAEKEASREEQARHWSYDGEEGPTHWGKLNPAWAQCDSGKRQSPIDIHDGIKVDLEPIKFNYKPVHFKVIDDGHTIRVDLEPGNHFTLTGHTYELKQFHFHRPSEEHVNGKGFQMVVHLVHKSDQGKLAVVSLLVDEGVANGIVQTVWNDLPLERNEPVVPTGTIDLSQLLPTVRDYYTYMGSLTTPPCTEGVLWMVMKQPIKMSAQQIGIFARLYPMNARPVQSNDGRIIKESN
jgi:carbonic anhydrase